MNILDMKTVLLSYVISNAICAIVMSALWLQHRRRSAGLNFWLADFIMQLLALFIIGMRGTIPDFVSIVIGGGLVIGGTLLLYIGLERYVGKISSQRHNYIFLAVFIFIHAYFTYAQPNMHARNLNLTLGLLVICSQCAWLLLYRVDAQMRQATKIAGVIMAAYSFISVVRIFVDLSSPSGNSLFQLGLYDTLVILTYQMLFVALTFALFLMANRRLLVELEHDIVERRKAEDSLKESESRYRTLFENMIEGFAYCRMIYNKNGVPIDWVYLDVNVSFEKLTGLKNVVGKHATDVIPGIANTNPELFDIYGRVVLTGKPEQFEIYLPALNIWLDISVFSPEKDCFVAAFENITERKKYEEDLKAANREWEETFNATPDPIILIDREHLIIKVNKSFTKRLNIEPEQCLGKHCYEIVHGTAGPPDFCPHSQTMIDGKEHSAEVDHKGANGIFLVSTAPVLNDKDEISGSVHVMHEITQRVRAEKMLKESESKYRELVELAQEGIWTIDKEAVTTFVNPKMAEMLGYSIDEMLGRHLFSFMDDNGVEIAKINLDRRKQGIKENHDFEFIRKDGSRIYTSLETTPMNDADGNYIGALAVVADLSERRRNEEKMRQVQKLESLGVLAGGVAHDFNNLLMVMLGNIDMSLMSIPEGSKAEKNLHAAEKACLSAADLTKQLLAYAGKGQFVMQEVNFNEVIQDMDMIMPISVSKKVNIKYSLDDNLPYVLADLGQMKQIIMNLVINASEAIGDTDGVVSVTTGLKLFENEIEDKEKIFLAENLKPGRFISVEVADSGCGIDIFAMDKMFDPFFTTKFMGRGLGLAAVMGIVRSMKGAIKVISEPGKGTVFTLYLPASDKQPEAKEAAASLQGGTVLLVDDEEDVITIGTQMLEALGYRVCIAVNGAEAVEIMKKQADAGMAEADRVAFILLDIGMPVMNGEEAYDEIIKLGLNTPVFISSGYGEDKVLSRFKGKKIAGILNKPYRIDVLKKAIDGYFKNNSQL
jgi:PAS domain S-box-containing protein